MVNELTEIQRDKITAITKNTGFNINISKKRININLIQTYANDHIRIDAYIKLLYSEFDDEPREWIYDIDFYSRASTVTELKESEKSIIAINKLIMTIMKKIYTNN